MSSLPRYYVKAGRYHLTIVDREAGRYVRSFGLRQFSGPDATRQMNRAAHDYCAARNAEEA